MEKREKRVDGFRFIPPGLRAWIRTSIPEEDFKGYIPWTPTTKPLSQMTIALVTSAGISLKSDRATTEKDIHVNHLHINTTYIEQDINVMLPLARMAEFELEGIIGHLAPKAYSFYGFQYQSTDFLQGAIEPISIQMKLEKADAVLLTPA
jgi:D-proline reductase (dithiol) PrdB